MSFNLTNRSYAIYGDSATTTATIVPSLTSAARSGSVLEVVKDINAGAYWQNLTLNDSNITTYESYEYPISESMTTNSDGSTKGVTVFEFQTKGPVKMDRLMVQFSAKVEYIDAQTTKTENPALLSQGEYGFFNYIEQIDVRFGQNRLQINQMPNDCNTFGMKLHMITKKKTETNRAYLAAFGLTQAKGVDANNTLGPVTPNYFDSNEFSKTFGTLTGNDSGVRNFSFALSDVLSFFNQGNTYLPAGLNLMITIYWSTPPKADGNQIMGFPKLATMRNVDNSPLNSFIMNYMYDVPRKDMIDGVNRKQVVMPMLFNYNRYTRYSYPIGAETSFEFSKVIFTNEQRPLAIIIWFTLPNSSWQTDSEGATAASIKYFPYSSAPGIKIDETKIYINGHLMHDQRNNNSDTSTALLNQTSNASQIVKSLFTEENEHERPNDFFNTLQKTNQAVWGSPLIYPINPGLNYKRGTFSTDEGPVQLTLEMKVTKGTKALLLNVYCITPAQVKIDDNMNLAQIQWPAVVAQNGNVMQRTINT